MRPAASFSSAIIHSKMYNFEPDQPIYYKITDNVVGHAPQCGTFGTPTLPDALDRLNLTQPYASTGDVQYVMFDTEDCGDADVRNYLVVYDVFF